MSPRNDRLTDSLTMGERRLRAFYAAIRGQDVDGIALWFTPTAQHRIYSASAISQGQFSGEWNGVGAIRSRFGQFRELWTIETLTVTNLVTDGAKGAAKVELTARANSGFRTLAVQSLHFVAFEGDLIAEFEVFIDVMAVARMSVADPSPGRPT